MLPVSTAFDVAAKATVRRPKAIVRVTWTDSMIDASISVSASESNRISLLDQVVDGEEDVAYKWFRLGESDLSGDFHPAPTDPLDGQVGWWGTVETDGAGEFASDPYLTVEFDPRPVIGVRVAGDPAYGEYPVDFSVLVFSGVTQLCLLPITGNTELARQITFESVGGPYPSADKIILVVSKWSAVGTVVKITEFYSSVIGVYDGDDIVGLSLLEEAEVKDGTIPIGNIASNELDLSLGNIKLSDGTYDPFNPDNEDSLWHTLIKPGRRIEPFLGFELPGGTIEAVPLGKFWSGDWKIGNRSGEASTTARDRMEFLRLAKYQQPIIYYDTTLYDYLDAILTFAVTDIPMSDLQWSITTELQSYSVQWAWIENTTYFEAIRRVCAAGLCQAWMSRLDVLTVGRVE